MDLKKLPVCRGYDYAYNIVGRHSRFAMGGAIKSKSASSVCAVLVETMYRHGPPRILQTDNSREFNNKALQEAVEEMQIMKINGRPYHPQSQGRVERFNQTLTNYLRRDLQREKDWPSRLSHFYYLYNNHVLGSLRGKTAAEVYFRTPNFSLFLEQSRCNLRKEDALFLETADMDVEGNGESDDEDDSADDVSQPARGHDDSEKTYEIELDWNVSDNKSTTGQSV